MEVKVDLEKSEVRITMDSDEALKVMAALSELLRDLSDRQGQEKMTTEIWARDTGTVIFEVQKNWKL